MVTMMCQYFILEKVSHSYSEISKVIADSLMWLSPPGAIQSCTYLELGNSGVIKSHEVIEVSMLWSAAKSRKYM